MVNFYKQKIKQLKNIRYLCIIIPIILIVIMCTLAFASATTYENRSLKNVKILNELTDKAKKQDLSTERFIVEFISNSDKETFTFINQGLYFGGTILGSVLVGQIFSLTKRINDYEEEIAKLENS